MADKEVFDFDQVKMPNVSPNLIKYGVIGIFVLIFIFSAFFKTAGDEEILTRPPQCLTARQTFPRLPIP